MPNDLSASSIIDICSSETPPGSPPSGDLRERSGGNMVRKCLALWLIFAMAAGGLVGIAGQRLHINKVAGARPLTFEHNRVQTDPQVKFLSRGGDRAYFLTSTEAAPDLSTATP